LDAFEKAECVKLSNQTIKYFAMFELDTAECVKKEKLM